MVSPLIILAGLPGSGKTTASNLLSEKGFSVVYMGDLTKSVLKEGGLPEAAVNEKFIRTYLRNKYGKSVYALVAGASIREYIKKGRLVVLEGLRSIEELLYFKKRFRPIKLIYIDASKQTRYERLLKRKIRPISIREAENRDDEELNILGIGKVKESADLILVNEISKKNFKDEILKAVYD